MRGGRSNFRLGCLPTDDFPQMAGSAMPVTFSLGAADLRTLIDRARFAISTEETPLLSERHLFARGQSRATSRCCARWRPMGIRLARVEMPLPDGAAEMPGVIVPRKTVAEVRKLLDDVTGQIEISLSDTKLRFAFDHVVLTSKLIDGTFPDYERVIPSGNDKVLEVNPREFASAVDRVATIATEKTRAVKLTIDRGTLTVSANSPESGSATEELGDRLYRDPARDRLQLPLPARHHPADRGRRLPPDHRRRRVADDHPRHVRRQRAVCPHADAGLSGAL